MLCAFQRIHVENGQKRSKVLDKKKIGFGLTIWFFMIYMYSYFSYKHLKDPAVTTQTELKGFAMFVKVMVFLIFCNKTIAQRQIATKCNFQKMPR